MASGMPRIRTHDKNAKEVLGMSTVLEVKDLQTFFHLDEGIVKAVDGVSFKLDKGKTLAIVGESGCGKTMTGFSIMQLIPKPGKIEGGEIWLNTPDKGRRNILELPAESAEMHSIRGKDIAMIFQEPMASLSPVHTVGFQIIEAIQTHQPMSKEDARALAIELLGEVGIPDPAQRVDSYSYELSGGMRQRAMIASALACDPAILIADEPTTAVDVTIQAQILRLLRQLQREKGTAIMLITHDLGVVASMADDVVVMYLGGVVESGPVENIFAEPKHPYTVGLIRSTPVLGKGKISELETIRGSVPSPFEHVSGCRFHPRCDSFMPGKCDKSMPPLVQLTEAHSTACWLYEELADSLSVGPKSSKVGGER